MKYIHARTLMIAALCIPLGACNSFLGIHFARHTPKAVPVRTAVTVAEATSTESGRQHLAADRTGLAIEAFQRALATGEPRAPAINGMGVAYARLGRYDLAKRYFEQAMATDPADQRYAANLARLMRSPTLAMRRDGDIADEAARQAMPVPQVESPARSAVAAPQPGRLQRISRGEVHITAAPAQGIPLQAGAAQTGPRVRVSVAAQKSPSFESVVRIEPPEPKPSTAEKVNEGSVASKPR